MRRRLPAQLLERVEVNLPLWSGLLNPSIELLAGRRVLRRGGEARQEVEQWHGIDQLAQRCDKMNRSSGFAWMAQVLSRLTVEQSQ